MASPNQRALAGLPRPGEDDRRHRAEVLVEAAADDPRERPFIHVVNDHHSWRGWCAEAARRATWGRRAGAPKGGTRHRQRSSTPSKVSTSTPACRTIARAVPSGTSPGWRGTVVRALVLGFHHISWLPRADRSNTYPSLSKTGHDVVVRQPGEPAHGDATGTSTSKSDPSTRNPLGTGSQLAVRVQEPPGNVGGDLQRLFHGAALGHETRQVGRPHRRLRGRALARRSAHGARQPARGARPRGLHRAPRAAARPWRPRLDARLLEPHRPPRRPRLRAHPRALRAGGDGASEHGPRPGVGRDARGGLAAEVVRGGTSLDPRAGGRLVA